ncbi:ATP-binding protein [Ferrimonas pelagia]
MLLLTLALLALMGAERYDNQRNLYNQTASDLLTQLTGIGYELQQEGLEPPKKGAILAEQFEPGENLFTLCDQQLNSVFVSQAVRKRSIGDLCAHVKRSQSKWSTQAVELAPKRHYYVYPLTMETASGEMHLVILRDANKAQRELAARNSWITIKSLILLPVILLLLISGALWGMKPLNRLGLQLQEIIEGKRSRLGKPEATELVGITHALNDMLEQSEQRREIYQNAMKDLAHSLKTRLAAIQAILDDPNSNPEHCRSDMYDQLTQMDQLIQYQLRKAVMGRQGLSTEKVAISPIVQQLTNMLDKVYRDKRLNFIIEIDDAIQFPINKEDLMEFLGNLMDNASRFAITTVKIRVEQDAEQQLLLTVEDDGPGIEPALRQKVLGRGERADERHPGQGIGLAVCNELSHSYGGQLIIGDSSLGGAAITLKLPNSHHYVDRP